MGSSTSKDAASAAASGKGLPRAATRSMVGSRVFQSSCLGSSWPPFYSESGNNGDGYPLDPNGNRNKENDVSLSQLDPQTVEEEDDDDDEVVVEEEEVVVVEEEEEVPHQILKQQQQQHHSCRNAAADLDKGDPTSSSQHEVSSTRSTRLRSRFSFIPGNLSFRRLSRAASFGSSSRSYSLFSYNNASALTTTANTQHRPLPTPIRTQARDLLPLPLCTAGGVHSSSTPHTGDISSSGSDALRFRPDTSSGLSPHPQNDGSYQDDDMPVINDDNTNALPDEGHHTSSIENTDVEFIQSRRSSRQIGAREPVERSVRYSRTLSVGRLRDRVLRRSSFTDGLFGRLHQERETGDPSHESRRRVWGEMTTIQDPDGNADVSQSSSTHPLSPVYSSIYSSQDDELETSRPREARYHDIMEHRTDFLERRRRIRSQVRALQRLGSRFENLSGHERSCILAGQHRSGRCTCRMSNRTRNPDDDTSARASISRIVMLAEALFEVLDEIHQQSVVLSSRASVSSLGSIPAPKEVVESMPVKIYTKLQKHQPEEVAQCYICLVEYEEGDCVRILPCHHEFHKTCIDKWLKEIHRVCPLCRGDVCRSGSLSSEN